MDSRIKKSAVRLVVMLPFLLILMGLGVGCESSLMLDEKSVSPDFTSSSSDLMTDSALPHTDQTQLDFLLTINYEVESTEGSNNPGPNITFSGLVTTGSGFGVNTVFRNNMKGTHENGEEKYAEAALMPLGKEIAIPEQPSHRVGSNPYLYIQFVNAQGKAVSNEIFIGRIGPGASFKGSQSVFNSATGHVDYTISGSENISGPNITFDACISFEELNARIVFRNNDKGKHEATEEVASIAQVIANGAMFSFPEHPVPGGVGGNPWIWTQFTNGNAKVVSEEVLLGRCEQISKSL